MPALLLAPLPATAQSPKLEAAYVVLGPQGAVARAILADASVAPRSPSTARKSR